MGNRQGFPQLYDIHQGAFQEDLSFWLELANNNPEPILELGCGTGRVFLELTRHGHKMVGLDLDPAMLLFLKARIDDRKMGHPFIFQADMSAFHIRQQFGTIISPCNTLSTLSEDSRRKTFRCVVRHLHPRGLFSASIPNPERMRRLPGRVSSEIEEIFYHPLDQNPVQVSSSWTRSNTRLRVTWYYDHLKPDGRVDRTTCELNHSLDQAAVYQDDLYDAGFTAVSLFGDYDFSPYTSDSEYLILVAGISVS